ncbi:hypothetical protein, variant [Allomyces macrogynus ATCC 38327]|uniref:Uncharacterized protein n=1 Tax=Allomyces macrogynus (strain ATCC 38327) TaxID=578462 RepID=A0A0L0RV05_ALLM3|nr:hypothetical protein, variant [Allomyces macrogynus ATCC 38327]|eukprot:KNE54118.1 hypothetical protein, variant [Allomyces macrogynus ATCC 38327]
MPLHPVARPARRRPHRPRSRQLSEPRHPRHTRPTRPGSATCAICHLSCRSMPRLRAQRRPRPNRSSTTRRPRQAISPPRHPRAAHGLLSLLAVRCHRHRDRAHQRLAYRHPARSATGWEGYAAAQATVLSKRQTNLITKITEAHELVDSVTDLCLGRAKLAHRLESGLDQVHGLQTSVLDLETQFTRLLDLTAELLGEGEVEYLRRDDDHLRHDPASTAHARNGAA